ncbi:hypothetical protein FIBSPDRAFT_458797 [Athelia psychrophila]|uniref:Uncharacterized protein n=1 Tax=Athelia psychrophila TaxID=1759441 RepID=A0A167U9H4_9AGAM|nr:hypothetical protein FIBSPDRAFT_458797 [Fibularhizoctonia sp. CBS 109695]
MGTVRFLSSLLAMNQYRWRHEIPHLCQRSCTRLVQYRASIIEPRPQPHCYILVVFPFTSAIWHKYCNAWLANPSPRWYANLIPELTLSPTGFRMGTDHSCRCYPDSAAVHCPPFSFPQSFREDLAESISESSPRGVQS